MAFAIKKEEATIESRLDDLMARQDEIMAMLHQSIEDNKSRFTVLATLTLTLIEKKQQQATDEQHK